MYQGASGRGNWGAEAVQTIQVGLGSARPRLKFVTLVAGNKLEVKVAWRILGNQCIGVQMNKK